MTTTGGVPGPVPGVAARAVKLAEDGDEIVVRLQELNGRPTEVRVRFVAPVAAMREVNGAEEADVILPADLAPAHGEAALEDGALRVAFAPYELRTFALWLGSPRDRAAPPEVLPLPIPYNVDGISLESDPTDGDFDGGATLAGELLPSMLVREGIPFRLGPKEDGALNVVACRGPDDRSAAGRLRLRLSARGGGRRRPRRGLLDRRHPGRDPGAGLRRADRPVGQPRLGRRVSRGIRTRSPRRT